MTLLLDTHILVWLAEGSGELSKPSVARLEAATRDTGLAVSAISFWEIAMLHRRRRITLSLPLQSWRALVLETPGFIEVPLTGDVAIESVNLPGDLDSDPADRMLIATARLRGWTMATRDDRIVDYGESGNVGVLKL